MRPQPSVGKREHEVDLRTAAGAVEIALREFQRQRGLAHLARPEQSDGRRVIQGVGQMGQKFA